MSKQIYIDSNGNEVQVSGTVNTADMMPMSGNDSTKVATAIGDLSTLTTSVKSSLVGAINEIATYTPVYGNTASGAIATFDTSLALPLQDLQIAINAVQESGTPTPSSPKAITGFTGANIKVQSRNWIPLTVSSIKSANQSFTWSDNVGTYQGLTVTLLTDDGITITGIKVNGTANAATNIMTPTYSVQGSYIFNGCVSGGTTDTYYMACKVNGNWLKTARDFGNGVTINGTITQSAITIANGAQINNLVFKPMLRVSTDTDSTYTPYTANTTAISWQDEADTVYGGSLDVTSGVLTDDYSDLLDLGNLSWGYNSNYGGIFYAQTSASHTKGQAILCDCYLTTTLSIEAPNTDWTNVPNLTIGLHYQGGVNYIYVKNSNYTDAVAFTSAMAGHKYITAIATPQTYQLTPTQISAIVGTNNVFTDTNGDTSVVYACSLKDYIDSQ